MGGGVSIVKAFSSVFFQAYVVASAIDGVLVGGGSLLVRVKTRKVLFFIGVIMYLVFCFKILLILAYWLILLLITVFIHNPHWLKVIIRHFILTIPLLFLINRAFII